MADKTVTPQQYAGRRRMFIISLVILAVLLVGTVVATVWLTRSDRQAAKAQLGDAIALRSPGQGQIPFTSQLGFAGTYDSEFLDGRGQVTTSAQDGVVSGQSYEGKELSTPRSYSIIKLQNKAVAVDSTQFGVFSRPELSILTSARREYFETRQSRYPGLNNLEITIREFAPPNGTLKSREQEVVNGLQYEKLLYELTAGSDTVVAYELQYVTVQNNRPYKATLHYYPSTKEGDLTALLQVLHSIEYQVPDANAQYLVGQGPEPTMLPQVAGAELILGSTVNTPSTLKAGTDLFIVAKNQLAVVRVGAIYCYNLTLLNLGGTASLQLPKACAAGGGSGAIMHKDGAVSTNGHVVIMSVHDALVTQIGLLVRGQDVDTLGQYMDYFASINLLSRTDAQKLATSLKANNAEAFETIRALLSKLPSSRVQVHNQSGEYAIQLSDQPLKVSIKGNNLSFNYGSTIVKADYVDSNFNVQNNNPATSTASDVALLDIKDDRVFPVVKVGNMNSLRQGSELTVVGFPGFVDGGLLTPKSRTIPTATQGAVTSLAKDAGNNLLVATNVPIAEGNSGGPAFNKNGEQIGLATYAMLSASDVGLGKTKFSKESYIRNVADFTALADAHNLDLTGESSINDAWYPAIEAFSAGDYGTALGHLKKVRAAYSNNYLVADLINTAEGQAGGFRKLARTILLRVAIPALLGAIIMQIIILLRHRTKKNATFTNYTGAPPVVSAQ